MGKTGFAWRESLEEERSMLAELAELSQAARQAPLAAGAAPSLEQVLARQAELCVRLEEAQKRRRRFLEERGASARDFLTAALAETDRAEHGAVIAAFSAYVEAARAAQRQIDINKDFFKVALSAVEATVMSLTGEAPVGYAPAPAGTAGPRPIFVSVAC